MNVFPEPASDGGRGSTEVVQGQPISVASAQSTPVTQQGAPVMGVAARVADGWTTSVQNVRAWAAAQNELPQQQQQSGGATRFSVRSLFNDKNSPHVFTIDAIPIHVHWLLPALWLFSCLLGVLRDGWSGLGMSFVLTGPILFSIVLLHELFHAWAARREGTRVERIMMWPLGGICFIGRNASAKADLKVAAAGPMSHLPWMVVALALQLATAGGTLNTPNWAALLFANVLWMNISMMAFNLLLPCYPLDAGRILADFCQMRGLSADQSARFLLKFSIGVIIVLFSFFVYTCVIGRPAVLLFLVILWFAYETNYLHLHVKGNVAHLHELFSYNAAGATTAPPGAAREPGGAGEPGVPAAGPARQGGNSWWLPRVSSFDVTGGGGAAEAPAQVVPVTPASPPPPPPPPQPPQSVQAPAGPAPVKAVDTPVATPVATPLDTPVAIPVASPLPLTVATPVPLPVATASPLQNVAGTETNRLSENPFFTAQATPVQDTAPADPNNPFTNTRV